MEKDNVTRGIISGLLLSVVTLVALLFVGCATVPVTQVHGDVAVEHPTALLTGPATGHWAEQDEHPVIVYTVLGTDCTQLSAQAAEPTFVSHGSFTLASGETLCAIQLRDNQRVLFHAKR